MAVPQPSPGLFTRLLSSSPSPLDSAAAPSPRPRFTRPQRNHLRLRRGPVPDHDSEPHRRSDHGTPGGAPRAPPASSPSLLFYSLSHGAPALQRPAPIRPHERQLGSRLVRAPGAAGPARPAQLWKVQRMPERAAGRGGQRVVRRRRTRARALPRGSPSPRTSPPPSSSSSSRSPPPTHPCSISCVPTTTLLETGGLARGLLSPTAS